ncbi:ArsB/NhaD family transporter [Fusibacter bizertensis]|uniref:ArsB/NhaD family transporter n=1 Tax=Fusibacter bizertensis TaxID=1488331 RepID=A0ABT6NDL1_9FIRM|nr:ArsB/NhaD family transporter [Fusibacter bizertensis]MDH8678518.1 ArsB/NhaD family transporter [Fusibacter bizertensis]
MQFQLILAIGVFIVTYLLIMSEKMNRTAVAMVGAFLMVVLNIEGQERALHYVDFNTIGLLVGMMIIVNIMKKSGIFQYVAIKAAKIAKGDPWKIILYFCTITAFSSALLDNVTTVLLIVPVTLVITDTLDLNPIPFLVPEILIANIGGTATLIGDPPNIMIGSATGLGFLDFVVALGPVVVVIFFITMVIFKYGYKMHYVATDENKMKILRLDEKKAIKDPILMKKSIGVLLMTVLGFVLHQSMGYESATIALFAASVLLLISKCDVEDIFIEIEWATIFFFLALFILVGALEEVGVMEYLASKLLTVTGGNMTMTMIVILWVSAIASSVLDNIPFVATMIPLIKNYGVMSGLDVTPLWWALALGACLGGNGTLVGASANVIVSGLLARHGQKLSFGYYFKIGFPLMIVSIAISTVYLVVFII